MNLTIACPECYSPLGTLPRTDSTLVCPSCSSAYRQEDGVWRFLPPSRQRHFEQFLADYTAIRTREGYVSTDRNYFLQLPNVAPSDTHAEVWRVRSRSYERLAASVLPQFGRSLKVLDLGAGVGWLSHRLASLGHDPVAIDINVDARDGLVASRHYIPEWPVLQADFDALPVPPSSFDVAIFNGSLHYAIDYDATLTHALRAVVPGGGVVIMDTPIYSDENSGRQMVEEQRAFRSRAIACRQFLTWNEVNRLGNELKVQWTVHRPWYGARWALRPYIARLRRSREPAAFAILVCRRK